MALQDRSRGLRRGNPLAAWTISIVVAVIVFWGTLAFLNSQSTFDKRPGAGVITHSNPIGGRTLDGVYHPVEMTGDLIFNRSQI